MASERRRVQSRPAQRGTCRDRSRATQETRDRRDDERSAAARLRDVANIIARDPPVADLAADFMKRLYGDPARCNTCLSMKNSNPCKTCGAKISAQQRVMDAMIVAHAQLLPDVTVLYSNDSGVHEFKRHVRADLDIRYPVAPTGPLFDKTQPGTVVPMK